MSEPNPRDAGSASVWAITLTLAGMMVTAFVLAAGAKLRAAAEATHLAQGAARSAGQSIDKALAISTGEIRIDTFAARNAAAQWLDTHSQVQDYTVQTTPTTVTVTVTIERKSPFAELIAVGALTADGTATAEIQE